MILAVRRLAKKRAMEAPEQMDLLSISMWCKAKGVFATKDSTGGAYHLFGEGIGDEEGCVGNLNSVDHGRVKEP